MKKYQLAAILLLPLLLSACAQLRDAGCPSATCALARSARGRPAVPAPAAREALQPARWEDLPGWTEDDLAAAWPAFQQSCRGLAGKPQWPAWRQACEAAKAVDAKSGAASTASIRRFFETQFQPYVAVNPDGSRDGLVTGYYEPLLAGARARGEKARFRCTACRRTC